MEDHPPESRAEPGQLGGQPRCARPTHVHGRSLGGWGAGPALGAGAKDGKVREAVGGRPDYSQGLGGREGLGAGRREGRGGGRGQGMRPKDNTPVHAQGAVLGRGCGSGRRGRGANSYPLPLPGRYRWPEAGGLVLRPRRETEVRKGKRLAQVSKP